MNKVGGRWQRPPWLIKDSLPEEGLFRDDMEDEKSARRQAEGQAFWAAPFTLRLVAETPGMSRWGARWAVDVGAQSFPWGLYWVCSGFRSTYSVTHALLESSVAFGEYWDESVRCEFLIYRMPFGGGGAAVELTLFLLKIECF